MNTLKISMVVSLMSLGLALPSIASARDMLGSPRCNMTKLQLTETQKKQIREFKSERPSREEMRKEWMTYRAQTETIIKQKTFDAKRAQSLINNRQSKEAEVQLDHLKARHALFQILDENQKNIWLKECSLDMSPTQ